MNVYRYTYGYSYHERVPTAGGMDTDPTGRMIGAQRTCTILAPNQALADVYFHQNHDHLIDFKLEHVNDLGKLDAEVRTRYGTALG